MIKYEIRETGDSEFPFAVWDRDAQMHVRAFKTRRAALRLVNEGNDERRTITYTLDTNAGPIVSHDAASAAEMRRWTESMIPMLRRRGYSASWTRSGKWHVCNVHNSRGRLVHACAFTPESKFARSAS